MVAGALRGAPSPRVDWLAEFWSGRIPQSPKMIEESLRFFYILAFNTLWPEIRN